MLSTKSLSADELAEAACAKAINAPHGEKRKRRRVAVGARCLALALAVKQMRISMRTDAHEDAADPLGGKCAANQGPR